MKWIAWAFAFLFVVLGGQGEAPLALSPLGDLTVADASLFYHWEGDQYQVDMARVQELFPRYRREDYSIRVGEPFPDPYYERYRDVLVEECWYDPEMGEVHHWSGTYGEQWKARREKPLSPEEQAIWAERGLNTTGWTVGDWEDWNRLQPSGKLLFSADGTVIQEAHLSSYSGREGEFVPIPMGRLNIVDQSRDFSPPESYRYTQAEIETIRRWRITKEDFHSLSNRGYHPPEQVLSFSDEELLELFCGFQDGIGFDEWYDGLPPQDQAWVDSLIDREAGEGYLLYSLFDNMEDWRRIPPGEVPSILGWENWLRYVESHGYTRQEIEQLLRYEGKSHGEILLEIWGAINATQYKSASICTEE